MYIELHRSFRELLLTERPGVAATLKPTQGQPAMLLPTLLEQPRVVILAEGGAGKTWLLRQAAQRMRSDGKAAFFLRLEHVADEFDGAFDIGNLEDFEAWLASEEPGWVLLDSIDESRLRSSQDFEKAVRRVAARLAKALDRTHILMTGRPSAWRPKSDLDLCGQRFPLPLEQTEPSSWGRDQDPVFQVVQLEPLSPSQVKDYASAMGIGDIRQFLNDIERADAGSFTRRPQDLEELVEFWNGRGRIGSRLELMTASVQRRLHDSQNRAQAHPMTQEHLQEGVEKLAAALVLTRMQNIQVPDDARVGRGLRPRDVLGWDDAEIAALLQRSLFDPDVYGTVRFHHRSVLEYLAAQWFSGLLRQEVSRRRVEDLFFREQYGLQVVTPSLRPLLPWLVISDARILTRVQKVDPEIIFEGGDPLRLAPDVRATILEDACKQLAAGTSNRTSAQYNAIQRFAAPDVSETVRRLVRGYKDHTDVASFLLAMVCQGRITAALPEALEIALSATAAPQIRQIAFQAVSVVGTLLDMGGVRSQFASEGPGLDRRCMAELLNLVEKPDEASLQWLLDCIPRLEEFKDFESTGLTTATTRFLERADFSLIPEVIDRLYALLIAPPVIKRHDHFLSARNQWLRRPIGAVLGRLISARHPVALRNSALTALHLLMRDIPYDQDAHGVTEAGLPDVVQAWPALRWAWLWSLMDSQRAHGGIADLWTAQADMHPVVWDANDCEAALTAIEEREAPEDRLAALGIAFRLYLQAERPRDLYEQLLSAVGSDEALVRKLQQLESPPEGKALQELQRQSVERTQHHQEKAEWNRLKRREYAVWLAGGLDVLRDPGFSNPSYMCKEQWYMFDAMLDLEKSNHSGRKNFNWRGLEAEFGAPTAQAFRDGMVAFWRRYVPQLLSEGAQIDREPGANRFGMAGLTIDVMETPGLMAALSPAEARVAFRYAMRELNVFPDWFHDLFEAHPQVVAEMLLTEIAFELQMSISGTAAHYVIARAHHAREWLASALANGLLSVLAAHSPRHQLVLAQLVDILQVSDLPDADIAALARGQMTAGDPMHHSLWAAAWTSVDPAAAIDALEQHLDALGDAVQRMEFTMAFLAHLLGNRRNPSCMRGAYQTPAMLKRLYLLAHQYVRAEEDIDRSRMGVFSPGLRDDAQDAREILVQILQNIRGREAFLALHTLSQEHPQVDYRPWMAREARARAEADSERPAWNEKQVSDFAKTYERAPANHREMFDLAVSRLLDLKHATEDGDLSVASVVIRTERETHLRNWIAEWCSRHAHGRFVIPQEDELPDAKRPDLRWTSSTFAGAVPTELKIADNWTGPQLFERLERQLAGDYLRDQASTRGIYLLVWRGATKYRWRLPNDRSVGFEELIDELQAYGTYVATYHPGVEEIQVLGIDLTKRAGKTTACAPPAVD